MDKTLEEWQQQMPPDVKARHDAMTKAEAESAAAELEAEALKAGYFGNDCPVRGADGLAQMSDNFSLRASYFRCLAQSKS